MIEGSNLSKKISVYGARAQYDAEAKKILSNKILLSFILANTVQEFVGINPADIVELIEDVKVSEVSAEPGETNNPGIRGDSNEDTVPFENSVYFDVRFHVWLPDKSELIKMIIDVEAQRKFKPGYDLVTRGEFYTARLISAQKGTEFVDDDYDSIKKVYCIFICFNAPAYAANTITKFAMHQENIVGNLRKDIFRYDIPNVVLVCLSDKLVEEGDELKLHRLLGTVFSEKLKPAEKKSIIKTEFDIDMSEDLERRTTKMFDLSESIWESGVMEGKAEGRAEMILDTLADLGQVSDDVRVRVMSETDANVLKKWNKLAVQASSMKEFTQAIASET